MLCEENEKMKLIEEYADKVIASGAYDPLDRVYVMNKIRGFVGDEKTVKLPGKF